MIARRPRFFFYLVMALAIGLDQLTKAWAMQSLQPLGTVPLLPGLLNLTYNQNTGIAFGLFQHEGLLVGLFVVILALVALYYARGLDWAGWEPNLVGGCLCGGALGNLVDRSRLGYVVDFIDFHIGPHHWPIFNVADSLICLSVGWIVLKQLQSKD